MIRRAQILLKFDSSSQALDGAVGGYMASKRPIVASDLPTIREILNEENAILVEPGNPKALAEGIEKVLSKDIGVYK